MNIFIQLVIIGLIMLIPSESESKEDRFWAWFVKNQKTYYDEIGDLEERERLFDQLSEELHKIHEDLVFEFSPIHENGVRELTISADGLKELFPFVKNLVTAAPQIENWQINAFRQPIDGDDIKINFGELEVGYSDVFFRYAIKDDQIGLELNLRGFDDTGSYQNVVYILLDALIGEYNVVTKIDWIDWVRLDEAKVDSLLPLIELRDLIKSLDSNKD